MSVGGRLYGFGDFQRLLEKARVDPVSEAIEALEATAKILPERPDAHFHAARGLLALERREEARTQLDRALRLAPGFAPARILRDVLEESDEEERIPTDSVRQTEGADWQRVWLSAYRAMKEGRWTDASGHYGELIRIGETLGREPYLGSTIESRLGRGLARLEAKDFRAVEDFAWVQSLWPDALEPVLLRAKAYYLVNEELAEEEFQRVYHGIDESRQGEIALWITALYQSVWEYGRCAEWVERVKVDSVRESMKAVILFNLRRWEQALAAAEEAVELDPQDPATYRARAIIQARRVRDPDRDLDGALESLREALSVDENDYLSAYWMADVLMDTGNFEDAEKWLLRARDLNPSFGATYVYLGRCAFEAGRFQEAFDLYEQAREHGAHGPAGLNIRGTWFHSLGKLREALADYEEASRLGPNLIGPQINRGKLLRARGQYDQAADAFRAAAEGYPRTPDSHGYLGSLLEERGQLKEAFSEYRKAFELEPTLRDALKALSSLLRDRETAASLGEELDAFVKALNDVREPDREHRYVLTLKALAHIRQYPGRQDVDDAYAWMKQAVETMGERRDPYILTTLAEFQFREGNAAQAIVTLEEAVGRPEARPAHADLLVEYRRVSGALPSYRSIDAAMESVDRTSIDADRFRARLHSVPGGEETAQLKTYLEAWLLQLASEHEQAAREFVKLVEPGSARWEPLSRLVETLRQSGQSEKAERLLREVIEKSPKAHRDTWDLWLRVSFVDLRQSPAEILERLPVETRVGSEAPAPDSKTRPSYRDNVRWLLEQLSSTGVVRINCGGNEIEAPGGITWGRDRFAASGRRRSFLREVKGPPVCKSERWFPRDLHAPTAYRIPLPPGSYRLTLWFVESWYDAPGMRLFDVLAEGETLLTGYDVYASVGLATADEKQFDVRVEDGQLDVEFEHTKSEVWISGLEIQLLE